MELRRATDALLRSQVSPVAALLSPTASLRWANTAQLGHKACPHRQMQRGFSTTVQKKALKPNVTTSAPPPASSARAGSDGPSPNTSPEAYLWAHKPQEKFGDFARSKRSALFGNSTLSPEREKMFNRGSSDKDLLNTLNEQRPSQRGSGIGLDIGRMSMPGGITGTGMPFDVGTTTIPKKARKPIKLSPSTGRSMELGTTVDLATGFRLVEMNCARNKVKSDAMRQRFHERGGSKRKRLRSERWRKRFLDGFKATVARVKQLKHQGW